MRAGTRIPLTIKNHHNVFLCMDHGNLDALLVLVTKMSHVYALILNNRSYSSRVILFPRLLIEVMTLDLTG